VDREVPTRIVEPTLRRETYRERLCGVISHEYFVPVCLALGVVVRLLWIGLVDTPQVSDYKWYYERAVSIAEGRGYSVNGIPTAYWPVGYPSFLAGIFSIFGPSLFLAKLANVVLYLGVTLQTYLLSRKIFQSECAARITLVILSFYPNHIAYSALLSAEIPFAFLVLLGALSFVSARRAAGVQVLFAGLAWGLATLTKPQALFIPLIFIVVFCTSLRSVAKSGALIYLIIILVVTPWIVRNYIVMGAPRLDTHGGIVLFEGNNPYATGRANWTPQVASLLGDMATDENHLSDGNNEGRREARARKVALTYMMRNPWHTAVMWPRKLWAIYASDVDGFYYTLGIRLIQSPGDSLKALNSGFRVLGELYYVSILVLAGLPLPALLRQRSAILLVGILVSVYLTLIYVVFEGNARFHFAIMPWLAIYAGLGGSLLVKSYATGFLRNRLPALE
jgi:4-amino-4-deoxy-L-arabinose transferase-like glycosyltransferase